MTFPYPYTCLHCGKSGFDTKYKTRKFCTRDCQKAYHQSMRIEKRCLNCDKPFAVKYTDKKEAARRFCSSKCANQYNQPKDTTKRSTFICKRCGQPFEEYTYRHPHFCSRQCLSEYAARQPKLGARKPEAYITLNCKVCGKQYTVGRFYVEHRRSSYCSDACKYADISQRMQKHGNPNYRGGTVTYRGRNWGRQSRMALKRDGYICQICHKHLGKKGWDYGVHHIRPYREFNGDYEAANQLTNLITLCRSCHTKVEFGKMPCPRPLL